MHTLVRLGLALGLVTLTATLAADPYIGNPAVPYPPSCISGPLSELDLSAEHVSRLYTGSIRLETVKKIEPAWSAHNTALASLELYQYHCSEADRSVIIAEFRLPVEEMDNRKRQLSLPWVYIWGVQGFDVYPLQLRPEANLGMSSLPQSSLTRLSIGDYTQGWDDANQFTWRYVIDTLAVEGLWTKGSQGCWGVCRGSYSRDMSDGFTLTFQADDLGPALVVEVPSSIARSGHRAKLPLSGRLSGNWVESGSADQGFLLSFSSLPSLPGGFSEPSTTLKHDAPLVVFLSWFTFNADGELLWLTGAERFPQGAAEVDIPIEQVEQGQFMGSRIAQRRMVGSITLRTINCGQLEADFELGPLGLGAGTMQLERLEALEIADYPCRDYAALQTSLFGDLGN